MVMIVIMINLPAKLVRINEEVVPQDLVVIVAVVAVAREEDVGIAAEADKEPKTLTIRRIVLPKSKQHEKSIAID